MAELDRSETQPVRRATGCFAPDGPWIVVLALLIGDYVTVGLLGAWPSTILFDCILASQLGSYASSLARAPVAK